MNNSRYYLRKRAASSVFKSPGTIYQETSKLCEDFNDNYRKRRRVTHEPFQEQSSLFNGINHLDSDPVEDSDLEMDCGSIEQSFCYQPISDDDIEMEIDLPMESKQTDNPFSEVILQPATFQVPTAPVAPTAPQVRTDKTPFSGFNQMSSFGQPVFGQSAFGHRSFSDFPSQDQSQSQMDVEMNPEMDQVMMETDSPSNIINPSLGKWEEFATFVHHGQKGDRVKDFVSATRVKNHLMKDPILDWLRRYFKTHGLNSPEEIDLKLNQTEKWLQLHQERTHTYKAEQKQLNVLFEKGNSFEAAVEANLMKHFPSETVKLPHSQTWSQRERNYAKTISLMKDGVPIILQGNLINQRNKTFGVADIIVRSDYLDKIFEVSHYNPEEAAIPAPKLGTPYHYVIIDIKFTTLKLTADGIHLLNTNLMPAYKGQLLIYTAALGEIQGYTPEKAFVMGKAFRFSNSRNKRRHVTEGFNCYSRLGVIDYADRDESYLGKTMEALRWIRRLRYEGDQWSFFPQPTVKELYPNMSNSQYDSPYHGLKKDIAAALEELTSLWTVGVKHREHAHELGIFRYSDPKCSAESLGIRGKKTAPVVDRIIEMAQNNEDAVKLLPRLIHNNRQNWQTKYDIEFYVDFETIQPVFDRTQPINLYNSKMENNIIFMIGIGYEDHNGEWIYENLHIDSCHLSDPKDVIRQEKDLLVRFQQFVQAKITQHMEKQKITDPKLCHPRFFHWGHAETTMLKTANRRHQNRFMGLLNIPEWIDMLLVFRGEPITVKGAKKFGLKEIARNMEKHGLIQTKWDEDGPSGGLAAMEDSIDYYNLKHAYGHLPNHRRHEVQDRFTLAVGKFANVVDYNEIDCKVVWEIVDYLRTHHTTGSE